MKMKFRAFAISFILLILFNTEVHAVPAFPLKKSANNRYFVDQNNVPFFISGDTPWSLIGQVSKADADLFLNDAAAKGINTITVTLIEGHYADKAPNNFENTPPFTIPNNFSTPNPAYFAHADYVINKAASLGINVIIAPLYLGCCSDGWWNELGQNSEANVKALGEFIGNRYVNVPNIMYVWANDRNPCGPDGSTIQNCTQKDRLRTLIAAVKSKDTRHLHTYHWAPAYESPEEDPAVRIECD